MSDFDFDNWDDFLVTDAKINRQEMEGDLEFGPSTIRLELDSETLEFTEGDPVYKYGETVMSARKSEADALVERNKVYDERRELNKVIQDLKDEYSKKLQEFEAQQREMASRIWAVERAMRESQRQTKDAEQALRDALVNRQQAIAFQQKAAEFDKISAGFHWREFALPHQIDGAKFCATAGRSILADKMGLGKTLESLMVADMLKVQKLLIVVPDDVASNFVAEILHWAPHRHAILVGKRTKDEREMLFNLLLPAMEEVTVVINYSAWRKDKSILEKLADLRFEMVIMDEAHSIKNVRTSAFKGCAAVVLAENSCPECRGRLQSVHNDATDIDIWNGEKRDYFACVGESKTSSKRLPVQALQPGGCGWSDLRDIRLRVKRKAGDKRSVTKIITMTGTPILNKPTDVFAMLNLIDDVTYNKEADFINNYCFRDYDNKIKFRPGGMESLVKRLSGLYIGRDRKSAGVVLPKQEIQIHNLEFNRVKYAAQYEVIKQLTKHAAIMLSSGKVLPIPAIIALITRKRQANVWPAGIEISDPETGLVEFSVGEDVQESQKCDFIIERPQTSDSGEWEGLGWDITGEGDRLNGERLVIFSQFKTPLRELEKRFNEAGVSVVRFDGDTPQDIRDAVKIDFDRKHTPGEDYKWQVVLCNYKTGGVGLNFTAATQMIVLDEEWNPGKRDQAYARMDRIGQTEETTVHVLRHDASIDAWLAGLINDKENMINDFESGASMQQAFAEFLAKEEI
jgi:SNF2 family DNA or RNA helicase